MANETEKYPYGAGSHAPLADKREMPTCHPIKGNRNSMKYHRPDSQGYSDTVAEVWFDSPTAAEAAGFALAGGHSQEGRREDYEPGGSGHPCTVEQVNAARVAMGGAAGTFTSTSGSATVDGVAGAAGISGDMPDMPNVDGGGISGTAAAAGAAGVAGAAGLAASASGKLSGDMPDVNMPDVNAPDISAPDINAPSVDLNAPTMDTPKVDLNAPDISTPDISAPDISTPDISAPDISTPDINTPNIDTPDIGGCLLYTSPSPRDS